MNLFLDTNAVLYFLKGDPRAVKIVRDAESFGISFITVAELLSFDCDPAERHSIEQLIRLLKVYYPDSETTPIIIDLRKNHKNQIAGLYYCGSSQTEQSHPGYFRQRNDRKNQQKAADLSNRLNYQANDYSVSYCFLRGT